MQNGVYAMNNLSRKTPSQAFVEQLTGLSLDQVQEVLNEQDIEKPDHHIFNILFEKFCVKVAGEALLRKQRGKRL
jgi:hypothetical protein